MIAGEDGRPDEEGEDERAPLVLQLLLGSLEGQAPTLAHILLGFDAEDGPEGPAARLTHGLEYCWPQKGAPLILDPSHLNFGVQKKGETNVFSNT